MIYGFDDDKNKRKVLSNMNNCIVDIPFTVNAGGTVEGSFDMNAANIGILHKAIISAVLKIEYMPTGTTKKIYSFDAIDTGSFTYESGQYRIQSNIHLLQDYFNYTPSGGSYKSYIKYKISEVEGTSGQVSGVLKVLLLETLDIEVKTAS